MPVLGVLAENEKVGDGADNGKEARDGHAPVVHLVFVEIEETWHAIDRPHGT